MGAPNKAAAEGGGWWVVVVKGPAPPAGAVPQALLPFSLGPSARKSTLTHPHPHSHTHTHTHTHTGVPLALRFVCVLCLPVSLSSFSPLNGWAKEERRPFFSFSSFSLSLDVSGKTKERERRIKR